MSRFAARRSSDRKNVAAFGVLTPRLRQVCERSYVFPSDDDGPRSAMPRSDVRRSPEGFALRGTAGAARLKGLAGVRASRLDTGQDCFFGVSQQDVDRLEAGSREHTGP